MNIVFDIGATKTRVAASRDGQTLDAVEIVPTPADFEEGMSQLTKLILRLTNGEAVTAAAGGMAGKFEAERGVLHSAANLPGWVGQPLGERLGAVTKTPIRFANDTALVGLGEATVGAGKGYGLVAYVTISTGVNGVRVVDGRLDRTAFGNEIGFQFISEAEPGDAVLDGTWASLVSGRALEDRFGKPPQDLRDPELWRRVSRDVARGLHNTILHWSPEVVVLGGSMMRDISLGVINDELAKSLWMLPGRPELRLGTLGSLGGLHGALALLRD